MGAAGPIQSVLSLLLLSSLAFAQDDSAVIQKLTVSRGRVSIRKPDGSTVFTNSGSYPSSLLSKPQMPEQQTLEVAIDKVKAGEDTVTPQQAMVLLRHKALGVGAHAVLRAKGSELVASIDVAGVGKQIGKLAGEYEVSVLVGDPRYAEAIRWVLGDIELVISGGDADARPTVRTASTQPTSNAKPTIVHLHRPAEKRPPAMLSVVFAAAVWAPLAGVMAYVVFVLKINMNAFPKDGSLRASALLFHGSLAVVLGMCLMFWLKWNLVETLPRVLLACVPLYLSGHRLLSGLASGRIASGRMKKE